MLCCALDDRQQEIPWLVSGYLELWGHSVRHGVRISAIRGQQHFPAVQEDPVRRVRASFIHIPRVQRSPLENPQRGPHKAIQSRVDIRASLVQADRRCPPKQRHHGRLPSDAH